MKKLLVLAVLCACLPVLAQSQTTSDSTSGSTAASSNVNNPTFIYNAPVAAATPTASSSGPTASTSTNANFSSTDSSFRTNQAASAGTVFVNPPAADTCARAGNGFSVQGVGAGASLSLGGVESAKCDMRADSINLKVIGAPAEVIKARHCMDAQMAEAYARAGQPCVDKRPAAQMASADGANTAQR